MTSLSDPSSSNAITDGMAWVQGVALGTTATILSVVAVAAFGLLMLPGRLELRRGLSVVIGCFILFSASGMAKALVGAAMSQSMTTPPSSLSRDAPIAAVRDPGQRPSSYDPYAGASVPTTR